MRPSRFLDALPGYLGGRRRTVGAVMRMVEEIAPPGRGRLFVDPLCDDGAVALMAKARGYRVIAGDQSARGQAIARAFIANDSVTLSEADVARALETKLTGRWVPRAKDLPWPNEARNLLARLAAGADTFDGVRGDLLRALMVRVATALSMHGQVRSQGIAAGRRGEWDAMTSKQAAKVTDLMQPTALMHACLPEITRAVFANGLRCEAVGRDPLETAKLAAQEEDAVLFVFWPGADWVARERNYAPLDGMLDNGTAEPRKLPTLDDLLESVPKSVVRVVWSTGDAEPDARALADAEPTELRGGGSLILGG